MVPILRSFCFTINIGGENKRTKGSAWRTHPRQKRKEVITSMEQTEIILAHHDERISVLEREISGVKEIQAEIRTMSESLLVFAEELKHTNRHLEKQEARLSAMEDAPRVQAQKITLAVLSALSAALATAIIGLLFG